MKVPFTKESWNGRMKTCRGVEASLSEDEIERFDLEHREFLNKLAPGNFEVLHYVAMTIMKRKN